MSWVWLVSEASSAIFRHMAPLVITNPYLRDASVRHRILAESARDSSLFEGARHLPPVSHRPCMMAMNKNQYRGSNFDDFLQEEGILEEVELKAAKRVVALQLEKLMQKQSLSKSAMAKRMHTSRAALDRLLDASNRAVTLTTLDKVARVLGRRVKIELVAA